MAAPKNKISKLCVGEKLIFKYTSPTFLPKNLAHCVWTVSEINKEEFRNEIVIKHQEYKVPIYSNWGVWDYCKII